MAGGYMPHFTRGTTKNRRHHFAGMAVVFTAATLLSALVPGYSALALDDQAGEATVSLGNAITNTSLLSGTATDGDGVSTLTVQLTGASSGAALGAPQPVAVSAGGAWSLQLDESMFSLNLSDSATQVTTRLTDVFANTVIQNFGPVSYTAPDGEVFQAVTSLLASLSPSECVVSAALSDGSAYTIFGPNNSAFSGLPAAELSALLSRPGELCSVVSSHLHIGLAVSSESITSEASLPSADPEATAIEIKPAAPDQLAVNEWLTTSADNLSLAGLLHLIDGIIKPVSSAVGIDPIYTNLQSPHLKGHVVSTSASVLVRINGIEYSAVNNGDGSWEIPQEVVQLDPTDPTTLFTVLAYEDTPEGAHLVGLTMQNDVVHYSPAAAESASVPAKPQAARAVLAQTQSFESEQPQAISAEAESPIASEAAPARSIDTEQPQDDTEKSASQWYWWVIGVATLGALYYLLGGESNEPLSPKK